MKIPCQIKKFSIQALDSDRSVRMATVCYRDPITAAPTNEPFLGEKRACAKFQIDISKTEGLARAYTDSRTYVSGST